MESSHSHDRKRKRPVVVVKEAEAEADVATVEKSKSSWSSLSSSGLTRPPPTEEEVEEFFALIRRIHNYKYSGANGDVNEAGRKMELLVGLSAKHKPTSSDTANGSNGVSIDLNAVPEEANTAG